MTEHIVNVSDIEELIIAKYFIEQELIKQKLIPFKSTIDAFIKHHIDMVNTVAVYNSKTIPVLVPFCIYKLNDDVYIFVPNSSRYTKITVDKIRKLNYDISNLPKYDSEPDSDSFLRIEGGMYKF